MHPSSRPFRCSSFRLTTRYAGLASRIKRKNAANATGRRGRRPLQDKEERLTMNRRAGASPRPTQYHRETNYPAAAVVVAGTLQTNATAKPQSRFCVGVRGRHLSAAPGFFRVFLYKEIHKKNGEWPTRRSKSGAECRNYRIDNVKKYPGGTIVPPGYFYGTK